VITFLWRPASRSLLIMSRIKSLGLVGAGVDVVTGTALWKFNRLLSETFYSKRVANEFPDVWSL